MINPNVYPKGSVYHNYTGLGPVLDAGRGNIAYHIKDYDGLPRLGVPRPHHFPITLTCDIPIPQPEPQDAKPPVKPLTVEEIRERHKKRLFIFGTRLRVKSIGRIVLVNCTP